MTLGNLYATWIKPYPNFSKNRAESAKEIQKHLNDWKAIVKAPSPKAFNPTSPIYIATVVVFAITLIIERGDYEQLYLWVLLIIGFLSLNFYTILREYLFFKYLCSECFYMIYNAYSEFVFSYENGRDTLEVAGTHIFIDIKSASAEERYEEAKEGLNRARRKLNQNSLHVPTHIKGNINHANKEESQ